MPGEASNRYRVQTVDSNDNRRLLIVRALRQVETGKFQGVKACAGTEGPVYLPYNPLKGKWPP